MSAALSGLALGLIALLLAMFAYGAHRQRYQRMAVVVGGWFSLVFAFGAVLAFKSAAGL